MPEVINYGIVGCGMMGQEHARNIALLPDARVAAVFEPDAQMADAARKVVPAARMHGSLTGFLADPGIDCLVIASPNHLHAAQFEAIARTRPLPLLIEKPLYTRATDAKRIQGLAAEYPAQVWVGMEYRYMPPIKSFIEEVAEATGGPTMLTIREHRFPFLNKVGDWNRFNRNTGGTLVEKCCHFFDLMRHILDGEPERVMASAGQDVNHLNEDYGGETPDIWDGAYVIVEFGNGCRAMLELCMYADGSDYQEELTAVGPKGKIEARVPGPLRFWPENLGPPPQPQVVVSPREPKGPRSVDIPIDPDLQAIGDHNGATYYQHLRFLDMLRNHGEPEVRLLDGACAVEMGLAAQEAAAKGKVVHMRAVTLTEQDVSRKGATG